MSPDYLTTDEVSNLYKIPRRTLLLWREKRRGPSYYRFGQRVLYRPADIEAYIESCRVDPVNN